MSESVSRINVVCSAHNCQLRPVMADQCIFHSRVERNLWGEVTRFLNSPEGSKVIAKSRKNRMLWALGIFNETEKFHPNDDHPFNTREAFIDVYNGVKRHGALPEIVNKDSIEDVIKTLQGLGYQWTDDKGVKRYWTLDDLCLTYENLLVNYVVERAGKKE